VDIAFRQHYDHVGRAFYQLLTSKESKERQIGQVLVSLEYENLMTALNLALVAQVSIFNYYNALFEYQDITHDERRGLELGEMIIHLLENYPAEKLSGQLGVEFVSVIDNIARRQLALKEYVAAETSYQKVLEVTLKLEQIDKQFRDKMRASAYHQLGMVAQEQRQWIQAEQYYQQALQIDVEYNDRYKQAGTYHQLGAVAQEQRQWTQARDYFLRALEIFEEYKDDYSSGIALRNLARLWRASDDKGLPAAIAAIFNAKVDEVEKLLRQLSGDGDDKQSE
jgi:tetratricopeptide (TPR) repeat protein